MSGSDDVWFDRLFGFPEGEYSATQSKFSVTAEEGNLFLVSSENGVKYQCGAFTTPTLRELRELGAAVLAASSSSSAEGSGGAAASAAPSAARKGTVEVRHLAIPSSQALHAQYPGATFQAASGLNCLEFVGPAQTPEDGVTCYSHDRTQGPDCAIACAAGTVYRNYCVRMPDGSIGQRADNQLNNLDAVEAVVNNAEHDYWRVVSGYTRAGKNIAQLHEVVAAHREDMVSALRIGVQADTEVTWSSRWARPATATRCTVTQAYCSALSLGGYGGGVPDELWEPLARVVLDGAYEATLWTGVLAAARPGGCRDVFLTFVGGGVFGNKVEWIAGAMGRAVAALEAAGADLRVHVCHFRGVRKEVAAVVDAAVAAARGE